MLPPTATPNFKTLVDQYRDLAIEFPDLKGITLAQWAYESGWGGSGLSKRYGNYAGMKWGQCDAVYGSPAQLGTGRYTHFTSPTMFIEAYWHRLDVIDVYRGWRDHASDPHAFLERITPGWLNGRMPTGFLRSDEQTYVAQVSAIYITRTKELFACALPPASPPSVAPSLPESSSAGWRRYWPFSR